jgi:hypothetical protein
MTTRDLDQFTLAYIECALWASDTDSDATDPDCIDRNPAHSSICELPECTLAAMASDCHQFQQDNAADLAAWRDEFGSDEQAGHDFWLTRCGHGAGFWDRFSGGHPLHDAGTRLTDAAHVWGNIDLYVGDDGKVYQS